jgi:hypothetical protein
MILECLVATAVFALTCGVVLWVMKIHDAAARPGRPTRAPQSQKPPAMTS